MVGSVVRRSLTRSPTEKTLISNRKIERRGMDRVTGNISSRFYDGTNGKVAYHYFKSRFFYFNLHNQQLLPNRGTKEIYSENSELISPEK